MKWKALAAGATLVSTVLFSYAQPSAIDEKKFVVIEGIEQWITIKGNDRSNPAILFLHGGPGSPLSPYAEAIFKEWEREFVLVNWDQRGAGRSFGRNALEELDEAYILAHPLNLGQMTNDGIALTEYLLSYLEKEKIILFGTSWGTALGASMASVRPELYHAYLGHAQLVDPATLFKYTITPSRSLSNKMIRKQSKCCFPSVPRRISRPNIWVNSCGSSNNMSGQM